MKDNILLEDALLLIEQNFYFLHMGEFFACLSKKVDLSTKHDLRIKKQFPTKEEYSFNPQIIQTLLLDSKDTKDTDTTLFEYFVEMNAIRGMCMAMVEAMRLEGAFRIFMQNKLGVQFDSFFDITSFVRNVLSHNIHADMHLSERDYHGTLQRITRQKRNPNIHLYINYNKDLNEIQSPNEEYSFSCSIDFAALNNQVAFFDVVSQWELVMLCELCYNLVASYKVHQND